MYNKTHSLMYSSLHAMDKIDEWLKFNTKRYDFFTKTQDCSMRYREDEEDIQIYCEMIDYTISCCIYYLKQSNEAIMVINQIITPEQLEISTAFVRYMFAFLHTTHIAQVVIAEKTYTPDDVDFSLFYFLKHGITWVEQRLECVSSETLFIERRNQLAKEWFDINYRQFMQTESALFAFIPLCSLTNFYRKVL